MQNHTNKDGMSGFQVNRKNKSVPRGCLTGHWEINFHGCWWEVRDAEWGHDNFWMKGEYPAVITEHECSWDTVSWESNKHDNPVYEVAGLGELLHRNGRCEVCHRRLTEVYERLCIMDSNNEDVSL